MCTDFLVVAEDSSVVNGRSMEFGRHLGSRLLVRAPGERFRSPSPCGLSGLSWIAKYGYVGLTGVGDLPVLADGMNMQGLSAGSLWMPGSLYPPVTDDARALALVEFVDWVLGNFATVREVQDALNRGAVQLWEDDRTAHHVPLHFPIHDAQGNSLVVEFSDRKMNLYTNPVAVLTNHPSFPAQLANLGNYVGLSPYDAEPVTLGTRSFAPHGCGSGLLGLPGDSTPPSRFVRAAYLKQFARTPKNATEASLLAFHLLNAVDIPLGVSRARKGNDRDADDYTQWVVVKDLTNKVFNVRFYDSMLVQSVNLETLDFQAAGGKTFPVPSTPKGIDITSTLTR